MKSNITLIRWLLLLPALCLAFFAAQFVWQLAFPMVQRHLGISDEELYGMSIMDGEFVFGSYALVIFAFFFVLTGYLVAPRAKIIVSLVILFLGTLFWWGQVDFTLGLTGGGLAALFLAIVVHHFIQFATRQSKDHFPNKDSTSPSV
jgi:hypothetical protein